MTEPRRFLPLCWLLVSTAVCEAQVSAGLKGVVQTIEGVPIEGVEIAVMVQGATPVVSGPCGTFEIRGLPEGTFPVRIRRIGYKSVEFGVTLRPGDPKQVTVSLERGAYELPELVTTEPGRLKPIEYAWTTRYDDFFRRRSVGFGKFLTRADIEKRSPFRTPNLLAGIPGVSLRFRHSGPGGTDVEVGGCPRVSVWIDGQKQHVAVSDTLRHTESALAMMHPVSRSGEVLGMLLERVIPSQIELMEIYKGAAKMPAEFLDDSCAAVAIWTR